MNTFLFRAQSGQKTRKIPRENKNKSDAKHNLFAFGENPIKFCDQSKTDLGIHWQYMSVNGRFVKCLLPEEETFTPPDNVWLNR